MLYFFLKFSIRKSSIVNIKKYLIILESPIKDYSMFLGYFDQELFVKNAKSV